MGHPHPEARYFSLGKIDRDQVEDYHVRKRMSMAEVERWLRPSLNYDSADWVSPSEEVESLVSLVGSVAG